MIKTVEPFVADQPGVLTSINTQRCGRFNLQAPFPRVQKGQRFMVVVEDARCRLLPLLVPHPGLHG